MSTRCGVSLSLLVSWGQFLASDFLVPTLCRAPGGDPHHFVVSNSSYFDFRHFSNTTSWHGVGTRKCGRRKMGSCAVLRNSRSEERRVGKEWRSRRSGPAYTTKLLQRTLKTPSFVRAAE